MFGVISLFVLPYRAGFPDSNDSNYSIILFTVKRTFFNYLLNKWHLIFFDIVREKKLTFQHKFNNPKIFALLVRNVVNTDFFFLMQRKFLLF